MDHAHAHAPPRNAVRIGDNAYLFPSPAQGRVRDCFILGHGGTPRNDERFFEVPSGCSVNFFVESGKSNSIDHPIQGYQVMTGERGGRAPEIKPRDRHVGGTATGKCRDYVQERLRRLQAGEADLYLPSD